MDKSFHVFSFYLSSQPGRDDLSSYQDAPGAFRPARTGIVPVRCFRYVFTFPRFFIFGSNRCTPSGLDPSGPISPKFRTKTILPQLRIRATSVRPAPSQPARHVLDIMHAQLWTMVNPRDRNRKCLFGGFGNLVRISDLVQGTIHDRQGSTSQKKKISPDFGPSCPHHILAWPPPLPLIRRGNVRRHHGRVLHHLCDSNKEVWATDPRSPTCRFRGPEISRCGFVMTSARMRFCIDKTALRKCHFAQTASKSVAKMSF